MGGAFGSAVGRKNRVDHGRIEGDWARHGNHFGHRTLHLAARSGDELEKLKAEILGKHKVQVALHPGDLSTTRSMTALANAAGDVDILINNAGDIPAGTVEALAARFPFKPKTGSC